MIYSTHCRMYIINELGDFKMEKADLIAPEQYNIVTAFEQYASDESRKAVILQDEKNEIKEITYANLIKRANQIGNMFLAHGLQKEDKVLIMMPRAIETYALYIAALKIGLIIIPCSEMLRTKDLQYRITHSEAKAVVSIAKGTKEFAGVDEFDQLTKFIVDGSETNWVSLEDAAEKESTELETAATSRDDIAFLPYTSGTTGNPKAVIHTHGWGYAHLRMAPEHWLCIHKDDIVWATAAPGWQKWVWSPFLSVLGSGATAFVFQGRFEGSKYLELLERHQINVLCCTPTEYRIMVKSGHLSDYDLSHLHSAVSAGEPLNKEVVNQFQDNFDITVRDGYGQTESTLLIGFLKDTPYRPGSMGKAIPGSYVTIVDDDGQPLGPNEVGNIAVPLDLPSLFKGYYKDKKRTENPQRGDYFITGDQALQDEDGYFWFDGRKDDIIISSGYTIGPFEIEDSLTKHPSVKECAVVASPHEIRGNIVKAFVILNDDSEATDDTVKKLQQYVKQDVAPYKYPRAIEFVDDLPKTNSGKIRRVELRELEQQRFENNKNH